jgi:hypothetical protein
VIESLAEAEVKIDAPYIQRSLDGPHVL